MCVNCVRSQVDITDGIPKQLMLQFCRQCGRYLNPPNQWLNAELESKELLSLCIKKIRGLNRVKLVDAGFVWTEPHSRRVQVKLTIQKEVFTSTILQQVFVVEFVVQNQQCDGCQRYNAKDTWNAVVQVRQKVDHKRTFFYLEQIIMKHNAHQNTINVKEAPDGVDFFYVNRSHALKFVEFLNAIAPIRTTTAEKLISQDEHSNTFNYKYTFSVELIPVCREDLVCLPKKIAAYCGNISPLCLTYKVSNQLHLIDPNTLQVTTISPQLYWSNPFRTIAGQRQLVEYVVIDIQPLGAVNGKFVLAEITVARSQDFGSNDLIFNGRTHLGHILKPGDYALGYDISTSIFNDADVSAWKGNMPDFFLVKKSYPERRSKSKQRYWKLKQLDKDADETRKDTDKETRDYEMFIRDLEEDPELRSQVNLYKERHADEILRRNRAVAEEEMEDEAFPDVGLEELIEDLSLND